MKKNKYKNRTKKEKKLFVIYDNLDSEKKSTTKEKRKV